MPIYTDLAASLGEPYGSASIQALLAKLPSKKGLRKEGGYSASLTFKHEGLYLTFDWQRPAWLFSTAMLFPAGVEGFRGFVELIEGSVPIASKRPMVQSALGVPSRMGGSGQQLEGPGEIIDHFWDRYDFERYHLRFDYESADGAIHLVSLMSKECARELNPDLRDEDGRD